MSNRGQVKRAALSLLVSSWSFGRCSASETAFSSYSFMLLNILVGMKRNEPAIEKKNKKTNKQILLLNKAKKNMHSTCQSTRDSTASPSPSAENYHKACHSTTALKKSAFQRCTFLFLFLCIPLLLESEVSKALTNSSQNFTSLLAYNE